MISGAGFYVFPQDLTMLNGYIKYHPDTAHEVEPWNVTLGKIRLWWQEYLKTAEHPEILEWVMDHQRVSLQFDALPCVVNYLLEHPEWMANAFDGINDYQIYDIGEWLDMLDEAGCPSPRDKSRIQRTIK